VERCAHAKQCDCGTTLHSKIIILLAEVICLFKVPHALSIVKKIKGELVRNRNLKSRFEKLNILLSKSQPKT